ncbi:sulfurtransferase TusA family protein [Candidatus Neomarinimicrobiota bacterium]
MPEIKEDQILDCSGLNCPLPILKTKKKIDSMSAGQILKMISTDPGSASDVNAWSRRTGHKVLEYDNADNTFLFYIKKV